MPKFILAFIAMLLAFTSNLMAAATDFASALPTSLLPTGFWGLILLLFAVVVSIGGVMLVIKLIRRAM